MLVLESSSIVMLVFSFVDFATSFPYSFVKSSAPVNEFIKHYEAAFYNTEEVTNQHKRIKREPENDASSNAPLKLSISTSNKVFKLLLRPDHSLFAENVEFEGAKGRQIAFDPETAYIGTLEDDDRAKVRGIITKDGLFDGTITTQLEEFYVEPWSRYKGQARNDNTHSIIYKVSDVIYPISPLCAVPNPETKHKPTDLNTIAHRSKREQRRTFAPFENVDTTFKSSYVMHFNDELLKPWDERVSADNSWPKFRNLFSSQNQRSDFDSLPSGSNSKDKAVIGGHATLGPELASVASDGAFYDLDLVNLSPDPNIGGKKTFDDDNNRRYEFNDDQLHLYKPSNNTLLESNSKHWRPKTGLIDTVYRYTNVTKSSKGFLPPSGVLHKSNPKILIGNGVEESHANSIITGDDSLEQHARKRVVVDVKKTTCMLYLQADHLFSEKYGTEETCIEVMTRHVQRVNSIYRNTDFNQDGKPDNISFMIKRIKVHSLNDSSYRFPGNYGVEKFLEIFSEEDYDAFCLAYMFTYRDFEMGTLGLAWTGDLKNAGGVCEKNGHYRGSLKSLNTGIVTVLNYGKHVPSAVSHVTLAHEIGHNFGSPHDPDGCTPGGDDGNFIMFARATSGDKRNNNKFSPCSLHAINPVLNAKARSSKGCFTEPQTSICGNGVVEPGEECDCGWEEDCKDSCCYPQSRYQRIDETPCRLTPNSLCSPSQGPCCSNNCQLKVGDICRSDNGCRDSSFCIGSSPQCPLSINKPNKTVCNEEFVCYMGECTGSICLAYGLQSCQCIPTPSDPDTKACELCCKLPGDNQPCLSSFQWNQVPYDVPDMFAKPGTPCNNYNGYCDVFRKCREVDPSGPIATLRKLLLSEENIASFKKWAMDRWYYCTLIFLSFLFLMVFSTKILGKKPKVKTVTMVHSSPTETVRLPTDGVGGPAIVVHPIAVRSKLPFKKKVHEKKRQTKPHKGGEFVPHNVNNNNSPVEAKKKSGVKKRVGDSKAKGKSGKSKEPKSSAATATKNMNINVSEDPLGKVRNWLMQSHNMDNLGTLKKSESSPAGLDLSDPTSGEKRAQRVTATAAPVITSVNVTSPAVTVIKVKPKKGKKSKDNRVKLQVVYKPPFRFSVKFGRYKNDVSSHLIRDKRPDAVKQRAALFLRADRIRAEAATVAVSPPTNSPTKATLEKIKSPNKVKVIEPRRKETSVSKVEYKRSISAPHPPDPLYQNTVNNMGAGLREDKRLLEEPHYANLPSCESKVASAERENIFCGVTDGLMQKSKVRGSEVKRQHSSEARSSFVKHSKSAAPSSKRRNSCDAGVPNKATVEMLVKRQHSDETNVKSVNTEKSDVKSVKTRQSDSCNLKRSNFQSARANDHKSNVTNCIKPVRLKCSYDMETAMVRTPSVTTNKSPKRRNSQQEDNVFFNSKTKDRRSNVQRSMSNNAIKKESDKFKRFSLQHVDLTRFPHHEDGGGEKFPNVPTASRDIEILFCPAESTSEIPFDLEVYLSEVENGSNEV